MARTSARYCERLRVPVRWWLQGGLLVTSFWVAMVVAIPERAAWGIAAALMVMLAAALWAYGAARVEVKDGWLYVGRARIEVTFVGEVRALDADATRQWSGPLADARALLLLRPYRSQAVRIEIDDPDDPTPYWLVSSRRPAELAAALDLSRQNPAGGTSHTPAPSAGSETQSTNP